VRRWIRAAVPAAGRTAARPGVHAAAWGQVEAGGLSQLRGVAGARGAERSPPPSSAERARRVRAGCGASGRRWPLAGS
jgi:hypothetical protein